MSVVAPPHIIVGSTRFNRLDDVPGYYVSRGGRVYSLRRKRLLSPYKHHSGYMHVYMMCNGKQRFYSVHRLVAQAWLDNPSNKPQVNHKNGMKHDNRVSNLEWATHTENELHSYRELGRQAAQGERNGKTTLTSEQVLAIRAAQGSATVRALAAQYGVSKATVSKIHTRTTWAHL